MLLKCLFYGLVFLSTSLSAKTLHIEYGFNIFSIEISEQEIKYTKKSYSDVVTKKKCSENLFNNFSDRISRLTSKFPQSDKDSGDFMVKYRFGSLAGQLRPTSNYAKKLLLLSKDFDSFKLATEFRCEEG